MWTLLSLLFSTGTGTAAAQEPPPSAAAPALARGPELVHLEPAVYPEAAAASGLEVEVRLLLELDDTGAVVRTEVLEPMGHGFDEAAQAAVQASTFRPAEDASGPIAVVVEFTYAFTLDSQEPLAATVDNLGGVVRQKGTRVPLAGVEVRVELAGATHRTVTDEDGTWHLAGLPEGVAQVRAVFPGHDAAVAEVEIRPDEVAELGLWLRAESYEDTVAVGLYTRDEEVVVTRRTVSMAEARAVPGTLGDPIRVVQNLPGVARPGFLSGDLIIRGANPEDSRVFIDGVEVPIVYHLGGLRSVVPAGMVESVDYLPGSYPVRYGRGGGGVVDIRTTSAERFGTDEDPTDWKVQWRTDLLDTGIFAQGQAGPVGLSMGVRRSYIDAVLPAFIGDGPTVAPSWLDYQLKVEGLTDGPSKWSLFFFGLEDRLEIIIPEDFEGGDDGGDAPSGQLSNAFGSHRLVGSWTTQLSDQTRLQVQPSVGWDREQTDLGTDLEFAEDNVRFGLRGSMEWTPSDRIQLVPGVDMQAFAYDSSTFISSGLAGGGGPGGGGGGGPGGGGGDNPLSSDSSIEESEDQATDGKGWVFAPDLYLETRWRPLADPDRLVLQPGLRLVTMGITDTPFQVALDPRLAARWQAWEGGILKGGTGLHHQAPQDEALALSDGHALGFERTWSSEVGVEQDLWGQGSVDVTLFHRETNNRFVINDELVDLDTDSFFVAEGMGRSNGMEILLRKNARGPLSGWVSYTLSRSERLDHPDDPDADWILFDFDQTHILTATGTWRLPYDFTASARYQLVSGNPTTPYASGIVDLDSGRWTGVLAEDENSERLGAYSALDLRVAKLWTFKRWQLEGFVDLLNTVTGENPEGELWAYDYSDSAVISGLPFLPSVGFDAKVRF